jgi:hypothetical protein
MIIAKGADCRGSLSITANAQQVQKKGDVTELLNYI